jgi:hypothetical protein
MINWAALGMVGVVSLAVAIAVVVLVALAIVGLSAREHAAAGMATGGLSPTAGTAVAGLCLLATALIVLYGLWIIVS